MEIDFSDLRRHDTDELTRAHHELDSRIGKLQKNRFTDTTLLAEDKRRRLLLKEEIYRRRSRSSAQAA